MPGCCAGLEEEFGKSTARRDLRRYRRRGPIRTTRLLVEAVRAQGVEGMTLLDVGGGVGAVQHELFRAGLRSATHADASSHYLRASREEAERRGHADRVRYLHGDFVEVAERAPEADIVTLDRVICCYPDAEALVERSAARARRVYGFVLPRVRAGTRLAVPLFNLYHRARRLDFRIHLHSPERVDAILRGHGLVPRYRRDTLVWRVQVYARA